MTMPQRLRKLGFTITRDFSGSDARQVPASATLTPYREGAVASAGASVVALATGVAVTIFDKGRLEVGDTLQLASDLIAGSGTPTITVATIVSPTSITVDHSTGGTMTISIDDYLVPTNATPTLYDERSGASTLATWTSDGTTGRADAWASERFINILVSGSGLDSQMLHDEAAGDSGQIINVKDFPTIQDAIDFAEPGATVYLPSDNYAAEALVITEKITLLGDGIGNNLTGEAGTILNQVDTSSHIISCVTDQADYITIKGMRLQGVSSSGTGNGINMVASGSGVRISQVKLDDLFIVNCANHGVHFSQINFPWMSRVVSISNEAYGFSIANCAYVKMLHTYALDNETYGIHCGSTTGFHLSGLGVQDNQSASAADDLFPQLWLNTVHGVTIQNTDFENFNKTNAKTAIQFRSCRGVNIFANDFINSSETGTRGIFIEDNNRAVVIGPNRFNKVDTAIEIAVDSTISLDVFIHGQSYDTVATEIVMPTVANRDNKNIVAVDNTTGYVLPAYATGNLPTPATGNEGSIAYDLTTNTVKFSDGSAWANI